jgi:hypothetical protein
VHSEEQAKKVPKIFPTNEIARNKICSSDLMNVPLLSFYLSRINTLYTRAHLFINPIVSFLTLIIT